MENGGLLSVERAPVIGVIDGTDHKCAGPCRDEFFIRDDSKEYQKPYQTRGRDVRPSLHAEDFGGHVWEANGGRKEVENSVPLIR
jgi:hypothetical protein